MIHSSSAPHCESLGFESSLGTHQADSVLPTRSAIKTLSSSTPTVYTPSTLNSVVVGRFPGACSCCASAGIQQPRLNIKHAQQWRCCGCTTLSTCRAKQQGTASIAPSSILQMLLAFTAPPYVFLASSISFHAANYYLQDRLNAFMIMAREWRHLKMLKRAGRAYDPSDDRVGNTAAGSLAIPCRACPQPGMNMPLDLDAVDPSKRCAPTLLILLLR